MIAQCLAGKVALVTDSSRGIGRAITLRFAQKGAGVAINDSRDDTAARVPTAEVTPSDRRQNSAGERGTI